MNDKKRNDLYRSKNNMSNQNDRVIRQSDTRIQQSQKSKNMNYASINSQPNNKQKQLVRKKKKNLIKTFFKIFFSILILVLVIAGCTVAYVMSLFNDSDKNEDDSSWLSSFSKPEEPENINVLLMGIDPLGTHTDVMMLVNFNTGDGSLDIVSIPRDLQVIMLEENAEEVDEAYSGLIPSDRETKLTHVHHYAKTAGLDNAPEMTVEQVEYELGVNIDYWFTIDPEAFVYIVDEIGGVDFYVPFDMIERNGELVLEQGQQTLDGEDALELVRYRWGYADADLGRIEMQQEFMMALAEELTDGEDMFSDIMTVIKASFKYVDTNLTPTKAMKYADYINEVDIENIGMYMLPGEPETIEGHSYFIKDDEETAELMYDIMSLEDEEAVEVEPISSEGKTIAVYNGGDISGKASATSSLLEAAGFEVSKVADYDGIADEHTVIKVKEDGMGLDLVKFFDEPEIIVDSYMSYDIEIIIGTEEE